jgi:rhodanese-related sulfurtransferase
MSSTSPKQIIFESLAEVAKALGSSHRLELLERVAQGARSVEDLANATKLTVANTSRHLQLLRRAGLLEAERQGKRVFYRLAGEAQVVGLLKALGLVGERNVAQVQQVMQDFFLRRDSMEAVSRQELIGRLKDGTVTLLDVRPKEEFELGHLPGAINLPVRELKRGLAKLPKRREIVAYCRGPYCVMSFEAVAALRAMGYRVRRLEDGFPEWKAAGHAIEMAI